MLPKTHGMRMRSRLFLIMFMDIKVICREFFRICILQRKPQDLPASDTLLALCLIIYTTANVLVSLNKITLPKALEASLLDSILVASITLVVLGLSHRTARWKQTLTALAGTGCIMSLAALPIIYGNTIAGTDALRAVLFLLYMGLLVWNITVMGHILRYALDTSFVFGVIFALTYIFITSILINLVIPELEGA